MQWGSGAGEAIGALMAREIRAPKISRPKRCARPSPTPVFPAGTHQASQWAISPPDPTLARPLRGSFRCPGTAWAASSWLRVSRFLLPSSPGPLIVHPSQAPSTRPHKMVRA